MSITNYLANSAIEKHYGNGTVYVKAYNDSTAVTNGAIKVLTEKWITGIGVVLAMAAPATNATESNVIGIVDNTPAGQTTIAASSYGWVLVLGLYGSDADDYGVTTSGSVAANAQLEILNGGTAFIDAGAVGGAVWVAEGAALAVEQVDTNKWSVYLHGRPCQIKGS